MRKGKHENYRMPRRIGIGLMPRDGSSNGKGLHLASAV